MTSLRYPAAVAAALLLASCQPQTAPVASASGCQVPRIVADYEKTAPAQRPADAAPKAGVLPTPELKDTEAIVAGDCVRPRLLTTAATSDPRLRGAADWKRFSTQFYRSEHGRYLEVAGNALAAEYLKYEDGAAQPVGAVITKRSFQALQSGAVIQGPQFVIEKMPPGYDERVGDWKFTLISDAGAIIGESRGRDSDKVEYCVACHKTAWRQKFLFFVPPDYRVKN